MNNFLKNTLIMTSGIAAGMIAGILTAPKSGKDTREDIKSKVDELQEGIENLTSEARVKVESKIQKLKSTLKEVESQLNN